MMMTKVGSALRRIWRDQAGASLVELGLAAPFLALIVAGISDTSRFASEQYRLQNAVNRTIDRVLATPRDIPYNRAAAAYDFLRQETATAAGVPLAQVTLAQRRECDGTAAAAFVGTCPDGQEEARFLSFTVTRNFDGMFLYNGRAISATGAVRIQ